MNPLSTGFIIAPATNGTTARPAQVQALAAKLLTFGILIDPSRLESATVDQLTAIDEQFAKVEGLSQSKPMYPNFPKGVRQSSTLTLFLDQIVHYLSRGTWIPDTEPQLRKQLNLKDVLDPRVLQVITTPDEARDAFVELVSRPVSISEEVAAGFEDLVEAFPEIKNEVIGDVVFARNRENMGWALAALELTNEELIAAIGFMKNHNQLLVALAVRYFDTDTVNSVKLDVAKSVRTKNINRQVRYAILRALPELVVDKKFPADEMLGHKFLWRKILHNIHPTEFDLTQEQKVLIDAVHDKSGYISRAAAFELACAQGNAEVAALAYAEKPGQLLRNVLQLMKFDNRDKAIDVVSRVGHKAKVSTIVSSLQAVRSRIRGDVSFVKTKGVGNVSKIERKVTPEEIQAYKKLDVVVTKALGKALGRVEPDQGTISTGNAEFAMPLVARDCADAGVGKALVRGQRVKVEGNTLRGFVFWDTFNGGNNVDIDLGIQMFDKDMKKVGASTFHTYYDYRGFLTFSGDLTHVLPGGSAEYYDVDVEKLREARPDVRYLVLDAYVYSAPYGAKGLADLDHVAGFMTRSDKGDEGEIFDYRSVEASGTSKMNSRSVYIVAFDVDTNEMIWMDSTSGQAGSFSSNYFDDDSSQVLKGVVNPVLPVSEVLGLWAEACDHPVDPSQDVDMGQVRALLEA